MDKPKNETKPEDKLQSWDVDQSLYAMMRAAKAKKDKEHMKLCMEEATKRKKQLGMIMKDMPMEKSQELKIKVSNRLTKSFNEKDLTKEEIELISIDVMLKAIELEKSEAISQEATQTVIASGTQELVDPTVKKELKFAGNLFQDFKIGSSIQNNSNGTSQLANAKRSPQDYVQNGNKSKNQVYTEEQLKAELSPKKV